MSKNKKIIILVIAIIIILAIAAIVGYIAINKINKKDEEKKIEWGDVYLEVLKDDKKLEDMDNQKLQLCDLDKDGIPEMILYGIKNAKEFIANIYKINSENKVDKVKVSLDEEFDMELLYNGDKNDYEWYAVSSEENQEVYDLNIVTKKYKPEKLEIDYKNDMIKVEDNYSQKINFNPTASNKDKKEILEKAKEKYVPTDKMITTEVKEKVEDFKEIKNIEKIDYTKDLVYSGNKVENSYIKAEYPVINIKSSDVQKINDEIEKKYGFKTGEDLMEMSFGEMQEMGYEYSINDNILSLMLYHGGNNSIWTECYNIDLKTKKQITSEDVLKTKVLSVKDVKSEIQKAAEKKFDEVISKDKKRIGTSFDELYPANEVSKWKNEIEKNIQDFDKCVYINKDGEFIAYITISHPGGQWSCYLTITINISNYYSVREFEVENIENYVEFDVSQNMTSPSISE